MSAQIFNFAEFKQKWSPETVRIGDTVAFEDWNGETHEAVVAGISFEPDDGYCPGEQVSSFPLWEKSEYIIELQDGCSIVGGIITHKIIRRRSLNAN